MFFLGLEPLLCYSRFESRLLVNPFLKSFPVNAVTVVAAGAGISCSSLVQATSQRRWLWVAFQPARNEITFVVSLEWSERASLPLLLSEHCIPPVAVLRGSPALRYVTKAVCSVNCLWVQKSSDPKLCLSACQLSPSAQASGDPVHISDREVGA